MLNVLIRHIHNGSEKLIQVPADWQLWQIFRHVRSNYPKYCFYESWSNEDDRGSGRVTAIAA